MTELLYITRKVRGTGGMQRLNADLWKGFQQFPGVRVKRVAPLFFADVSFPLRALFSAYRSRRYVSRIHLGDAALCPLGAALGRMTGIPISVTACGLDVVYPKKWYQRLLRSSLPAMDHVVSISRWTAHQVEGRGVPHAKISVIPCGTWETSQTQRTTQSPLTLLTVARLIPRKGAAWFLRHVFPLLLKEIPTLRYIIIGSGPCETGIRSIIRSLHLETSVQLLIDCDDRTRDGWLNRAHLFVMPNIERADDPEGFGIACIEAGSRGLPVAAASIDGITDAVIEGKTGHFFRSEDPDDCARVILQALKRPLPSASVSRETMKHFHWPGLLHSYRHVFAL
ncbi:glycosyltransferase family 4 protein [Candidatus Peregrinibacteria bacterium]|nr:glycosyltransferase family 4 protein [Candidatus Peregrinibacteria bacterium]